MENNDKDTVAKFAASYGKPLTENVTADNNTIRLFLWDVPPPEQDSVDEIARGEVALINWTEGIPEFIVLAQGFESSPTFFRDKESDVLRYIRIVPIRPPEPVAPSSPEGAD